MNNTVFLFYSIICFSILHFIYLLLIQRFKWYICELGVSSSKYALTT